MFVRHPFNWGSRTATNLCHNWNRSPCLKSPRFAMCWILLVCWTYEMPKNSATICYDCYVYIIYIYTYIHIPAIFRLRSPIKTRSATSPHLSACHETMARSGTCRGRPSIILPWLPCPHVYVYRIESKKEPGILWKIPEIATDSLILGGTESNPEAWPRDNSMAHQMWPGWTGCPQIGKPEGYVSGISSISFSGIGVVLR